MRFRIIYFLVQSSFFATVLGYFSQCNFKVFRQQPTMVANVFTRPPTTLTKLLTALSYIDFFSNHTNFRVQNFLKRTCPDFESVTPLVLNIF